MHDTDPPPIHDLLPIELASTADERRKNFATSFLPPVCRMALDKRIELLSKRAAEGAEKSIFDGEVFLLADYTPAPVHFNSSGEFRDETNEALHPSGPGIFEDE